MAMKTVIDMQIFEAPWSPNGGGGICNKSLHISISKLKHLGKQNLQCTTLH